MSESNGKNYTVIEYTPGYLPEEDEPAAFEHYSDAYNYVLERRKEVLESEWAYDWPEEGEAEPIYMLEVSEMETWGFVYYDKRKTFDLGRRVEIVPLEL